MTYVTMEKCPCCGQAWPESDKIEIDNFTRCISRYGKRVRLSDKQFKIFQVIWKYPMVLTRDEIIQKVYADDPDGGPLHSSTLSVTINFANKRLKEIGLSMGSKQGSCAGYHVSGS